MIVGLTGGIACGKSTVTGMLRDIGAYVVDADVWARRVVEKGSKGLERIVQAFGQDVLSDDGTLDRKALGNIIFHDETARQTLNQITHPLVRQGMRDETAAFLEQHPGQPVVWDVPLLFEGETKNYVDLTVLVYVDETTQLARLVQRDGISKEAALARIRSQMPIEQKRSLADYVIDNMGTLDETRGLVQETWTTIISRATMNDSESSL